MTSAEHDVLIEPDGLPGLLCVPGAARGLVVFVHGSGSSRLSPRNRQVATALGDAGYGTLLFDLLHVHEAEDRRNVFDIPLLASRTVTAVDWLDRAAAARRWPIGLFGASTGAAAALVAATHLYGRIAAVISRGGRPDLAGEALERVRAPTLLVVGGQDREVLDLNRRAFDRLRCTKTLEIVPGATHLFEEPGTLDAVTAHAITWLDRFVRHTANDRSSPPVDDL